MVLINEMVGRVMLMIVVVVAEKVAEMVTIVIALGSSGGLERGYIAFNSYLLHLFVDFTM